MGCCIAKLIEFSLSKFSCGKLGPWVKAGSLNVGMYLLVGTQKTDILEWQTQQVWEHLRCPGSEDWGKPLQSTCRLVQTEV